VELAAAFDAAKSGGVIVAAIAAVFIIGYEGPDGDAPGVRLDLASTQHLWR
jgi:hypothetical protein